VWTCRRHTATDKRHGPRGRNTPDTRTEVDTHLQHAILNRLRITEVAQLRMLDPNVDQRAGLPVRKAVNPFVKVFSAVDRVHRLVSFASLFAQR